MRVQKHLLSLVIFFTFCQASFGQELPDSYWKNICYSNNPVSNLNKDSTIIVVSNRVFDTLSANGPFLGNCINKEKENHYFVSTKSKGKWHTFSQPSLDSALRFLPDRNLVLFVHGDGKSYPVLLKRTLDIQSIYHVAVIAFDYPSLVPEFSSIRNFYNSRRNIKNSLKNFGAFLTQTKKALTLNHNYADKRKTLFLHSLGNYLLREYIEEEELNNQDSVWIDNLVLNSAAVKQRNHKDWLEELKFQERIYVTSNKNDFTLQGAMIITFSKQLGGNIKAPLYSEAKYINLTSVADKVHNCFLDVDLLQDDNKVRFFYREVLNGRKLDLTDTTRFTPREDCLGFDLK